MAGAMPAAVAAVLSPSAGAEYTPVKVLLQFPAGVLELSDRDSVTFSIPLSMLAVSSSADIGVVNVTVAPTIKHANLWTVGEEQFKRGAGDADEPRATVDVSSDAAHLVSDKPTGLWIPGKLVDRSSPDAVCKAALPAMSIQYDKASGRPAMMCLSERVLLNFDVESTVLPIDRKELVASKRTVVQVPAATLQLGADGKYAIKAPTKLAAVDSDGQGASFALTGAGVDVSDHVVHVVMAEGQFEQDSESQKAVIELPEGVLLNRTTTDMAAFTLPAHLVAVAGAGPVPRITVSLPTGPLKPGRGGFLHAALDADIVLAKPEAPPLPAAPKAEAAPTPAAAVAVTTQQLPLWQLALIGAGVFCLLVVVIPLVILLAVFLDKRRY